MRVVTCLAAAVLWRGRFEGKANDEGGLAWHRVHIDGAGKLLRDDAIDDFEAETGP